MDEVFIVVSPYLAHSGTKGQKWGIRRWQNKDGSLTPEGRIHYGIGQKRKIGQYINEDGSLTDLGRMHYNLAMYKAHEYYNNSGLNERKRQDEEEKEALGIKKIDDDTEVIPKGVEFQRICDAGEPLTNDRKYMSLLSTDNDVYKELSEFLPVENPDNEVVMKYESKNEIRVATEKKVKEEMMKFIGDKKVSMLEGDMKESLGKKQASKFLKMYGDLKVSDLENANDYLTALALTSKVGKKIYGKSMLKTDKWLADYLTIGTEVVNANANILLLGDDRKSEFYDHMKSLGYNAFIDAYDTGTYTSTYPLIILDTADNMKVKSSEKLKHSALDGQYLAHHGTKGQQWGIRRWQNQDGSLTPEGRIHYGVGDGRKKKKKSKYQYKDGSLTEAGQKQYEAIKQKAIEGNKISEEVDRITQEEKKRLGIKSVDADTDIIPKGVTFTRITSGEDKLDNDRKYVSVLKSDTEEYASMTEMLPVGDYDTMKSVEYQSTGELKVATYEKTRKELMSFIGENKVDKYVSDIQYAFGEKKAKQILKTYGNMKLSEFIVDHETRDALKYNSDHTFSKKELKKNAWLEDYLSIGNRIVREASDKVIMGTNRQSEFYDHMKKLGYNAFVDVYDAAGGAFKYPLVLLDPKDHVKQTKETKIYDYNDD